jgi:hypothetical protein
MSPSANPVIRRLSARFWSLIELSRSDWPRFVEALQQLSDHDRWKLYWTYSAALGVLRTPDYEEHAAPDLVEDGLYDLAAWIVAQGRDYYMDVVDHPDQMPDDLPDEPYEQGYPLDEIVGVRPEGMGAPEDDDYFFE